MIHRAPNLDDFVKTVSSTLDLSRKLNRFTTMGTSTEKVKDITKVSIAQYMSGSAYVPRMKRREGKDFQPKRKSFYGDYNENGSVKYLLSDPSKLYVCVWKSKIKSFVECYMDSRGNLIEKKDIPGFVEGEPDSPRYFHIENIWYLSCNGQQIITEDFELYKGLLDNL